MCLAGEVGLMTVLYVCVAGEVESRTHQVGGLMTAEERVHACC